MSGKSVSDLVDYSPAGVSDKTVQEILEFRDSVIRQISYLEERAKDDLLEAKQGHKFIVKLDSMNVSKAHSLAKKYPCERGPGFYFDKMLESIGE